MDEDSRTVGTARLTNATILAFSASEGIIGSRDPIVGQKLGGGESAPWVSEVVRLAQVVATRFGLFQAQSDQLPEVSTYAAIRPLAVA